ncbi:aspartate, glycine, lysine and serine-rich protein-like [Pungitius pungitius]|uniref:aspartate, glycine, lysine and serine-rich protein-like n=1 Tax=Pungitius pungitius TaxID=134920 RepID=UPI002E12EF28
MGAFWALIVAVLALWFTTGSGLPVGDTNEMRSNGPQRTMRDVSPNDPSIKKVLTLQQSHQSVFLKKSKEVQLETNKVAVKLSAVYLEVVEHAQNRGRKDSSNVGHNGTLGDDGGNAGNSTVGDDGNAGSSNGTLGDDGNSTVGDDGNAGNGTLGDNANAGNGTLGDDGNSTVDDGNACLDTL